jgi:hypothetical protein
MAGTFPLYLRTDVECNCESILTPADFDNGRVVAIFALRELRRRAQRQATARMDEAQALPRSFRPLYGRSSRSARTSTSEADPDVSKTFIASRHRPAIIRRGHGHFIPQPVREH